MFTLLNLREITEFSMEGYTIEEVYSPRRLNCGHILSFKFLKGMEKFTKLQISYSYSQWILECRKLLKSIHRIKRNEDTPGPAKTEKKT